MADREKVIKMLNNTLRHCHNLYNHVASEEQTWLAEINQGAKDALSLLKEQPEIGRCKDCRRKGTYECPIYAGAFSWFVLPDEWFCAGGEKR